MNETITEEELTKDKLFNKLMGIKASPLARVVAEKLDVDLTKVNGSGPGRRIVKDDVLMFAGMGALASHTPDAVDDKFHCGQPVIFEEDLSLTYPVDAPDPKNIGIVATIKWLRSKELRLCLKETTWMKHSNGTGMTQIKPLTSADICGAEGVFHLIDEVLDYGANVKQRRYQMDPRIFDWAQSLAPKFYERLVEQRQEWLAKTAAKKNMCWFKF